MRPIKLLALIFHTIYCGVLNDQIGYGYPQPQPPIFQFDEPSTPSNVYIPPFQEDEIVPIVPVAPPSPTYLPPILYPPLNLPPVNNDDTVVISGLYQTPVSSKLRVVNMSCVMDGFFRTMVRVESKGNSVPNLVVDDGPDSCITQGPGINFFRMEMEGIKMTECGVRRCGDSLKTHMCLTVRMPTIRSLKLPEDNVVTLQCAPQDSIVSHVKHLRLNSNSITRGRSNGGANLVATGGSQRNFNTKISLHRKSPGSGSFDQQILPGSLVQLGEELVLRAQVQDGDGWEYSRMGAVVIRSGSSQKSLTLIEENGCRSPGLKSIISQQPRHSSTLVSQVSFRAFLFQGSNKGDDNMVLSVRVIGCLHAKDCYQRSSCEDTNLLRSKRNTNKSPGDGQRPGSELEEVTNWKTLYFRVLAPEEYKLAAGEAGQPSHELIIVGTILSLFLFVLVAVYMGRRLLV